MMAKCWIPVVSYQTDQREALQNDLVWKHASRYRSLSLSLSCSPTHSTPRLHLCLPIGAPLPALLVIGVA